MDRRASVGESQKKILRYVIVLAAFIGGPLLFWRLNRCLVQHEVIERWHTSYCLGDSAFIPHLRSVPYVDSTTAFWTDRSYHTFHTVARLKGLHFIPLARNEERPYRIDVQDGIEWVYTLANRDDLNGLDDWEVLPDTVLVFDAYAPRRFDVLLRNGLGTGVFMVKGPAGGPSHPVFFDPGKVKVAQR